MLDRGVPRKSVSNAASPLARRLWAFLWVRKRYWLLPIVVLTALFGALIAFSRGSTVAPFLYTIF